MCQEDPGELGDMREGPRGRKRERAVERQKGDNERTEETDISSRSSGSIRNERKSLPLFAANYDRNATRMHLRACVCAHAHGGLVNEHKIGGDRS